MLMAESSPGSVYGQDLHPAPGLVRLLSQYLRTAESIRGAEQAGCELLCYLHRHQTLYEPPLTMKTQLSEMNRMWL